MLFLLFLLRCAASISFPVLDMTSESICEEVDEASRTIGFFVVVNHGVDEAKVRRAWRETEKFFSLPLYEKMKAPQMTSDYVYGYSPLQGETLSANGSEGDLKEMFSTGPHDRASGQPPPRFPSQPPRFRQAWHEYYLEMETLSQKLLSLMACALKISPEFFAAKSDKHLSSLRALNYPAASYGTGGMRASEHTDYGSLTILRSGGPGLQVKNRTSGAWLDVPTLRKSHFVINLGDLMSRWTNDRWISTPHRVVFPSLSSPPPPPPKANRIPFLSSLLAAAAARRHEKKKISKRRQSLAFFHNLNADANVSVIETCLAEGEEPKYAPIVAKEHLLQKHREATSQKRA